MEDSSDKSDILHYAVEHKTKSNVESLLEQNINVDSLDKRKRSALHVAVIKDRKEMVELLIAKGANIDIKDKRSGLTPLYLAIKQKNLKLVKLLLKKGANVNEITKHDLTALHIALKIQDLAVVKILLDYGANIRATKIGRSPLHTAVESKNIELAKLLLVRGCEVNIVCMAGVTPLHLAIETKNSEMVKLLLDFGAITDKKRFGKCLLFLAVDSNSIEIADILMAAEVHSCSRYEQKCFALRRALECKKKDFVLKFLDYGFDPNSKIGDKYFLHFACECEWEDVVQQLLKKGANVLAVTSLNETGLHIALGKKNSNITKLLLAHGAEINVQHDRTGITPLYLAVRNKLEDLARLLLSRGANPNIATSLSITPLHIAFELRNQNMITLLLEYGANPSIPKHGKSLLEMSIENNWLDMTRKLLERGADINSIGAGNSTMLMIAIMQDRGDKLELIRLLLDFGAQVNSKEPNTLRSPLQLAAHVRNVAAAELLIARGAEVNYETPNGMTALQFALQNHCKDMVRMLLENGASIEVKEKNSMGALHVASLRDWCDIAEMVMDRGADVNELTHFLATPLIFAMDKQNTKMAKMLIDRGANVNCISSSGRTPLRTAVSHQMPEMVKLLLDNGARVNEPKECYVKTLQTVINNPDDHVMRLLVARNACAVLRFSLGKSPLHFAVETGNIQIVNILLDRGAELNDEDDEGKTPVHLAVKINSIKMTKLLIDRGANLNVVSRASMETCLHYALSNRNEKMLGLLLNEKPLIYAGKNSAFQFALDTQNLTLIEIILQYDYDLPENINYVHEFLLQIARFQESCTWIAELLFKHLVRKNISISSRNLYKFETPDSMKLFRQVCDDEIMEMKTDVFYEATTFYHILVRKSDNLTALASNENLVEAFYCGLECREYTVYKRILLRQMKRAKELLKLNNEAENVLDILTGHILPPLLIRKILSYLAISNKNILKKLNRELLTAD